jgi:hypothetical protein
MSGPSEKAIQAALAMDEVGCLEALEAGHDPALGLDRSVCLRDVVEALRRPSDDLILAMVRSSFDPHIKGPNTVQRQTAVNDLGTTADFIEREFGGGS